MFARAHVRVSWRRRQALFYNSTAKNVSPMEHSNEIGRTKQLPQKNTDARREKETAYLR